MPRQKSSACLCLAEVAVAAQGIPNRSLGSEPALRRLWALEPALRQPRALGPAVLQPCTLTPGCACTLVTPDQA